MLRRVTVTQKVYDRILALRGERTRGRCKTMSDVISDYIPDAEEEFETDEAANDYEEPEEDDEE